MRRIILAGISCFTLFFANGQRLHIGIGGGMANYQGDLLDKFYVREQINGFIGAGVYYELYDQLLIRGYFSFARVNGDDRFSKKDVLKLRNLRFESAIAELSVNGELHLFNLNEKRFSPYVFTGLSVFRFNPYTHDASLNKVFLKPLSTEGQGLPGYPDKKPYSLVQPAIPYGGGLRFAVTENLRVSVELGFRKLFTDYLDDVSTSYADPADLLAAKGQLAVDLSYRGDEMAGGNPNYPSKGTQRGGANKDNYYFTGIHLSYRIGNSGGGSFFRPGVKGRKNSLGCPTVN